MEAKLIESTELAPEVRHFVFEVPEVEKFTFVPGQFVSMNQVINEKKITRAYSIASAPSDTNRFELCLNLVHEGLLSPRLFQMQPGDSIEIRPPLGMANPASMRSSVVLPQPEAPTKANISPL